jgi:hypothetical protein
MQPKGTRLPDARTSRDTGPDGRTWLQWTEPAAAASHSRLTQDLATPGAHVPMPEKVSALTSAGVDVRKGDREVPATTHRVGEHCVHIESVQVFLDRVSRRSDFPRTRDGF